MKTAWLLSEEGLLFVNGEPVSNVPFGATPVVAGAASGDLLAVIVDHHEVWTRTGGCWRRAATAPEELNCISITADKRLLVGSAGARLAWIAGGEACFIGNFDDLPERSLWKTPWGGPPDVRSMAVAPDGTLYANVHVGWIARSKDGGRTWESIHKGLHMDVHQVATHPVNPAIVIAATAGGFHFSEDWGETFAIRNEGMPSLYQRACACFDSGEVFLASTSCGPHGCAEALLLRSENAGKNWEQVKGLPESLEKNIDTHQIFILGKAHGLVMVDNSVVYETFDEGIHWRQMGSFPRLFGGVVVPDRG